MIVILLKLLFSLVIPIGYVFTFEDTQQFPILYHLLIILSSLMSIAFILRVKSHRSVSILGYIFFITYIIGYFIQFFLLMFIISNHQIDTAQVILGYDFTQKIFTKYSQMDFYNAFEAMSLFYCCMLAAFIFLSFSRLNISFRFRVEKSISLEVLESLPNYLLYTGVILLFIIFTLHLGQPRAIQLPAGLAGFIMLSAKYIIPFGLLFSVWMSESLQKPSNANSIYFIYTLLLYLATLSKFVLVSSFVFLFIIWLLAGTLTPLRQKKILWALVIFVALYPFLNLFRGMMFSTNSLTAAIIERDTSLLIALYNTFGSIVMRFSGYVNILLFIQDTHPFDLYRTFDLLNTPLTLNDYAGYQLMGEYFYTISNQFGMAASYFGGLYFLYGNIAIPFLITFILITMLLISLALLQSSNLKTTPVIYLFLMTQLIFIFVDGFNLINTLRFIVPLVVSIILFELLIRNQHA